MKPYVKAGIMFSLTLCFLPLRANALVIGPPIIIISAIKLAGFFVSFSAVPVAALIRIVKGPGLKRNLLIIIAALLGLFLFVFIVTKVFVPSYVAVKTGPTYVFSSLTQVPIQAFEDDTSVSTTPLPYYKPPSFKQTVGILLNDFLSLIDLYLFSTLFLSFILFAPVFTMSLIAYKHFEGSFNWKKSLLLAATIALLLGMLSTFVLHLRYIRL